MSHNESCHAMSHVAHSYELTTGSDDLFIWMCMNESCHTMSHFTSMSESCHMYDDSLIHGTWLIHTWDMNHSYMGHDSFIHFFSVFICVTQLKSYVMCLIHTWHDSFIHVTFFPFFFNMRRFILGMHEYSFSLDAASFIRDTRLVCMYHVSFVFDMNESCVWHDSLCVRANIQARSMLPYLHVWHDLFLCIIRTWHDSF